MKDMQLGTGVSISIEATTGKKIALELEYQASRLSGENTGELPSPDIEQNEYTSPLILNLGKPKLLASTPNSSLMILIELDSN